MENREFTENDWKLFKSRLPGWQEAYMDRLNKEYIELLSSDANAVDKFWKLEKRIRRDKERKGVVCEMRRSVMIYNIIGLLNEGAIKAEDLEEFSDELKERIYGLCGCWIQ